MDKGPSVRIDRQRLRAVATTCACLLLLTGAALPAVTTAGDTSVTIVNLGPEVLTVSLPSTDLSPTAGSTTTSELHVTVEDANGCSDIDRVSVHVNQDDNSTHDPAVDLMQNGGWDSCTLGIAHFNHTIEMDYHDPPAVDGSTYKVYVEAEDQDGATTNNLLDLGGLLTFTYSKLAALAVSPQTIDFGSDLGPGESSSTQSTGIENQGNVDIDLDLSGTELSHSTESASLPVDSIEYSTQADMTSSTSLSSTASSLSYGLASGASSSDDLYWAITVPTADENGWIPSGSYQGDVTVTALETP